MLVKIWKLMVIKKQLHKANFLFSASLREKPSMKPPTKSDAVSKSRDHLIFSHYFQDLLYVSR